MSTGGGPPPIPPSARRTEAIVRTWLFLVSYAPLALIVGLRALPDWRWVTIGAGSALLLTVLLWVALRQQQHSGDWPVTFTEVRGQGAAVSGYLATYLLPFLSSAPESLGAWGAYAVFFLVALIVYIRSDLAMVNPTLYLLGYRLSEASDSTRRVLVISRAPIQSGESVRVTSFLNAYAVKQGS